VGATLVTVPVPTRVVNAGVVGMATPPSEPNPTPVDLTARRTLFTGGVPVNLKPLKERASPLTIAVDDENPSHNVHDEEAKDKEDDERSYSVRKSVDASIAAVQDGLNAMAVNHASKPTLLKP
jgi:hypothetical protein